MSCWRDYRLAGRDQVQALDLVIAAGDRGSAGAVPLVEAGEPVGDLHHPIPLRAAEIGEQVHAGPGGLVGQPGQDGVAGALAGVKSGMSIRDSACSVG